MKIVALETIKYKGEKRIPGTDSAVFDCAKEIAEKLIADKKACLPQTLEQAGKPVAQQKAEAMISEAEKQAAEIIKAAEEKAAAMIADAEAQVAEIVDAAQQDLPTNEQEQQ